MVGGTMPACASARRNHRSVIRLALGRCLFMTSAALLTVTGGSARADGVPEIRVDTLEVGTSTRDMKRKALQAVPLTQLPAAQRAVADSILQDISLFRRLPTIRCESDARIYTYFCDHPDVAVSIWRAMGVSGVKMTETGRGAFACDAGDGTLGQVEVLYRTAASSLVSCKGTFTSPLLPKPIKGSALMHVQVQTQRDPSGKTYIIHKADLFVSFPSTAVDAVARTIAPVSNKMMDRNFEEISLFIRMMDEASRRRPEWIFDVAPRLDGVAKERPAELVDLTRQVHAGSEANSRTRTAIVPVVGPATR